MTTDSATAFSLVLRSASRPIGVSSRQAAQQGEAAQQGLEQSMKDVQAAATALAAPRADAADAWG